jgi:hypothetical protein
MEENKEISPIIESPKTYWFLMIFTATLTTICIYYLSIAVPGEYGSIFDKIFGKLMLFLYLYTLVKLLQKKFDFLIKLYIGIFLIGVIFTGGVIAGLVRGEVVMFGLDRLTMATIFGGSTLINLIILICLIKVLPKETSSNLVSVEGSENCDAKCPNCESLVKMHDEKCDTCEASFGELSTWRPQPL